MGRILIYGMGCAPDSECSDEDSDMDSDSEDAAASFDFIEEGLFDSFMAMHIRLGTTLLTTGDANFLNENKTTTNEEEQKEQKEQKEQEILLPKQCESLLQKLPCLRAVLKNACMNKMGQQYLNATARLCTLYSFMITIMYFTS